MLAHKGQRYKFLTQRIIRVFNSRHYGGLCCKEWMIHNQKKKNPSITQQEEEEISAKPETD